MIRGLPFKLNRKDFAGVAISVFFILGSYQQTAAEKTTLKIAIVGDTGIGERAFYHGFLAVATALEKEKPDLLLHLGDFVYQSEVFPETCEVQYKNDIFQYLVKPFSLHLFVPGDNDLPPMKDKPMASNCWEYIESLDAPFDEIQGSSKIAPGPSEGTKTVGNVLFAILNSYYESDPTPWLKPRIAKARGKGHWVIVAIHEPALTTAWFIEKRQALLKGLNQLQPDFVFAGNQHSYERFHSIGIPNPDGTLPTEKSDTSEYKRGKGTIHIISGGGGAMFKPFADLQGKKKRTAPKEVFDALAIRALMNHYVVLEVSENAVKGKTVRVCPDMENIQIGKTDPRWKSHKKLMWRNIPLACNGLPRGTDIYDRFLLHK